MPQKHRNELYHFLSLARLCFIPTAFELVIEYAVNESLENQLVLKLNGTYRLMTLTSGPNCFVVAYKALGVFIKVLLRLY